MFNFTNLLIITKQLFECSKHTLHCIVPLDSQHFENHCFQWFWGLRTTFFILWSYSFCTTVVLQGPLYLEIQPAASGSRWELELLVKVRFLLQNVWRRSPLPQPTMQQPTVRKLSKQPNSFYDLCVLPRDENMLIKYAWGGGWIEGPGPDLHPCFHQSQKCAGKLIFAYK